MRSEAMQSWSPEYKRIVEEIDALPCAAMPTTIPPDSILDQFGCHRSYVLPCPHGSSNRLRVYGFLSSEKRDAFVSHYAAEGAVTLPSLINVSA